MGAGDGLASVRFDDIFVATFDNPWLSTLEDQARFDLDTLLGRGQRLAVTTDFYVVDPLFFPGGDIGKLAVSGTVNDLAVSGARPLYLTCGMIVEESLEMAILRRVAESMKAGGPCGGGHRYRRHQGRPQGRGR